MPIGRPIGTQNKTHIPKVKITCPRCGKEFEVYPSTLKFNARRGSKTTCCSRSCAGKIRPKDWIKYGWAAHNFKDGSSSYRSTAIRAKGLTCEKCGYDGTKYPSLIWVHHKDFSKRGAYNNDLGNLEVLCVRCHLELHCAIQK
jgi:hypothetical protein